MSSGSYCSPKNNNEFTCFSNDDLIKIAKYITKTTGFKIHIPNKFNRVTRQNLWKDIKHNYNRTNTCSEDYCIINNEDIYKIIGKNSIESNFRPLKPKTWIQNNTQWLSTIDIRKVMKQYEDKYREFKFIGPTPIDFDKRFNEHVCVNNELCDFNLGNFVKHGHTKIGTIFNLDPHNMSGSHWVSMFIDINTGGIYFYCSYGVKPCKEIQLLMKKVFEQGNQLIVNRRLDINKMDDMHTIARKYKILDDYNIEVEDGKLFVKNMLLFFGNYDNNLYAYPDTHNIIKDISGNIITLVNKIPNLLHKSNVVVMKSFRPFFNNIRFQFKNTECGVYSIYFIESFLKGKTYDQILDKIIKDNEMNKRRNIYYRPNIS